MATPILPQNRQPRPPGRHTPLKYTRVFWKTEEIPMGKPCFKFPNPGDIEEHHLQAALATHTVQIPIPGSVRLVKNYVELYPSNRWVDTATYLHSTQTISESCSAALLNHDYTYYMDESDKMWLDNTNYQCSVEERIAQESRSADTQEICGRLLISEDEFELVMGLFETLTGPQTREDDHINVAYVCFRNIPIRTRRVQKSKAGESTAGRLKAESSVQPLANEREKFSPWRSPTVELVEFPLWVPRWNIHRTHLSNQLMSERRPDMKLVPIPNSAPLYTATGGSCLNNGDDNAKPGAGVFYDGGNPNNLDARVSDNIEQSNQTGEVFAITLLAKYAPWR
ncbi:hypothetical protein B0H14DRAFT_2586523 [Mycena olivaceomarginata]|nr:hypothetical protein B0H14DRAFT_2586523 [Mycena olivaceomarginata]